MKFNLLSETKHSTVQGMTTILTIHFWAGINEIRKKNLISWKTFCHSLSSFSIQVFEIDTKTVHLKLYLKRPHPFAIFSMKFFFLEGQKQVYLKSYFFGNNWSCFFTAAGIEKGATCFQLLICWNFSFLHKGFILVC